jgi:uncharacterized membrane protein
MQTAPPSLPLNDAPARPGSAVAATRWLAAAGLLGLVALGLAWELKLAPTGRGGWAVKVLPLAFFLTGVLKLRMKSYRALSLLVWLYVAEGLVRATSERGPAVPLAWGQVALALLLFAACVAHVRLRLKCAPAGSPSA